MRVAGGRECMVRGRYPSYMGIKQGSCPLESHAAAKSL